VHRDSAQDEEEQESLILVRSERTFKVFKLAGNSFELMYDHLTKSAIDTIFAVFMAPDGDLMTILFAHNFVEHWTISNVSGACTASMQKRVFCQEENCILYSGDIHVTGLVAAGTVFRSLLIWQAETGALVQRLLGHTGVIFDCCFLSRADAGLVGSVSDDRTVRVWRAEK